MPRTLVLALVLAPVLPLALATPGLAMAETFPQAIVGSEVHSDDGTVIGHVTSVRRDGQGNVVSVAIPGLEPPDASSVLGTMVAENDATRRVFVIDRRYPRRGDDRGSDDRGSGARALLR